jgi:hypothetical protein
MATKIVDIAVRFEPRIASALLSAFAEIKDTVKITELTTLINQGGITAAYNYLNELQIEGIIEKHFVDDLNSAIVDSGRMTVSAIPSGATTGVPFRYNILNPATAEYIRTYELNLIQRIGANTREGIRQAIQADAIAGVNPISTARTFRDTIGLTPNQEQAVANFKTGLEDLDRRVLDRRLRDKRFDPTIRTAIENGTPLRRDQIEKMVARYRERFVQYRATTIARTEAMRATSIGSYTSIVQAAAEGSIDGERLRRFWVYSRGPRTRPAHRAIPSLNPGGVEIDQPFVTPLGPLMFPRDPNGTAENTINCRCTVVYKLLPKVSN